MSADEQKPIMQSSSQQLQRRSFLKMVAAGLAAAIPVAAGLLRPSKVLAYEPCEITLCVDTGADQSACVDGVLVEFDVWACYDSRNGEYCWSVGRNVRAIGCC
jgi:hypothetical protein